MRYSLLTLIFLFSSLNLYSQNGWFQQFSGSYNFQGIDFVNPNTGWVVSFENFNSTVLRTTNGGNNWISISTINGVRCYDIEFINENTGFVCGVSDFLDAKIYKSTNGGINWIDNVFQDEFWEFFDLNFINSSTGFCVGEEGKIYKTTNTGVNWIKYPNPSTFDLIRNIFFINNNTGWLGSGAETGLIYRTTNCGINWNSYIFGFQEFHSIFFFNDTLGIGCGTNGQNISRFYRTTNAGVNWTVSSFPSVIVLESIAMTDTAKGWMTGLASDNRGFIYFTTNKGVSWTLQFSSASAMPLSRLIALDSMTAWTISTNGKIYKYGDITSRQSISSEIPRHFFLHQNYPNPFNPSTKIKLEIPLSRGVSEGRGVLTKLSIYDILGREVRMLVNENLKPGVYEVDFNASDMPSGVYFYKLTAGKFVDTKKMIIMK